MPWNPGIPDEKRRAKATVLAIALIVAVTWIVHWKTLFGACCSSNYDPVTQYYPMAQRYQSSSLSDLMWTPEVGLGWPLFLSGYWPVFAPLHLVAFLAPGGAVWWCNVLYWFYYVSGGVLFFLCARRFGISAAGALAGTFAYLLASWTVLTLFHLVLISGLWLVPALLLLHVKADRVRIVPTALILAAGVLCAAPPMWLAALAFCSVFLLVRFWGTAALVPSLVRWGVGVVCGTGLAAVQWWPCYVLARASERYQDFPLRLSVVPFLRAVGGIVLTRFDSLPKFSVNNHTYIGAAMLLLAVAAVLRAPRRWEALFFLGCMVAAFLFALDTSTPVWWLALRLPLVGIFGDTSRWLLVYVFSAAMLAGYGLDRVAQEEGVRRLLSRLVRIGLALYGLVWLTSSVGYGVLWVGEGRIRAYGQEYVEQFIGKPPHFHPRDFYGRKLDGMIRSARREVAPWNSHCWAALLAMTALWLLLRKRGEGEALARPGAWAIACAAGLELLAIALPCVNRETSGPSPPTACELTSLLPKETASYRVYTFYPMMTHFRVIQEVGPTTNEERSRIHVQYFHELLYPETNLSEGVHQFGNALALIPRLENLLLEPVGWPRVFRGGQLVGYIWDSFLSPKEKVSRFLGHLKLLKAFNVRFLISTLPLDHPSAKLIHKRELSLNDRADPVTIHLYELTDYVPRAFVVPEAKVVPNDEEAAKTLNAPEFDPRKTVLLPVPAPPLDGPPLSPEGCSVTVTDYRPRCVRVHVRSNGSGFLALSDAWSPEWTVAVDGKESPLLRANVACRAVAVGAGEHTVEFTHHARMVRQGILFGAVALVALCLVGVAGFFPLRRREAA